MDTDRSDQHTTGREEQPEMADSFRHLGAMMNLKVYHYQLGAHSERETPVPIPNTAVKPLSGYNTWFLSLGK